LAFDFSTIPLHKSCPLFDVNESTWRPSTSSAIAKYSPSYPCFLKQMASLVDSGKPVFGGGTNQPGLHATIEVVVNKGPYEPGLDDPEFDEHRGPRCYDPADFCDPFPEQPPDGPLRDGTAPTPPPRPACDKQPSSGTVPSAAQSVRANGLGLANSPGERDLIAHLLAPEIGVAPADMPGWSSLLLGPLLRGTEVSVR